MTALALWPQGKLEYKQQWSYGKFVDNNTLCLQNNTRPHPDHQPTGLNIVHDPNCALRNGNEQVWIQVHEGVWNYKQGGFVEPRIWHNYNVAIDQTLIKTAIGRWQYEYYLRQQPDKPEMPLKGVSWVGWDKRNRLVFTRVGQLLTGSPVNEELRPQLIADFNNMTPENIISPEWARQW